MPFFEERFSFQKVDPLSGIEYCECIGVQVCSSETYVVGSNWKEGGHLPAPGELEIACSGAGGEPLMCEQRSDVVRTLH